MHLKDSTLFVVFSYIKSSLFIWSFKTVFTLSVNDSDGDGDGGGGGGSGGGSGGGGHSVVAVVSLLYDITYITNMF